MKINPQETRTPPKSSKVLYTELIDIDDPPVDILGDDDRSRVRRTGTLLARNRDRIFEIGSTDPERWKICGTDPSKTKNRVLWYLKLVG